MRGFIFQRPPPKIFLQFKTMVRQKVLRWSVPHRGNVLGLSSGDTILPQAQENACQECGLNAAPQNATTQQEGVATHNPIPWLHVYQRGTNQPSFPTAIARLDGGYPPIGGTEPG